MPILINGQGGLNSQQTTVAIEKDFIITVGSDKLFLHPETRTSEKSDFSEAFSVYSSSPVQHGNITGGSRPHSACNFAKKRFQPENPPNWFSGAYLQIGLNVS